MKMNMKDYMRVSMIAAAKEKDSTSTRLELATVKSILEDIYSL